LEFFMNIFVCVKQTYDLQQVRIRKETRQPVLENVPLTLGNIDKNALEEAVRIKERTGGKITVLSAGPETLEETIKEALAMGADEAVLVTAPELGSIESALSAVLLAKAADQAGPFDLILLGEGSTDNYSGQVGPRLAELLDLPQITFAKSLSIEGRILRAARSLEDCFEEVEVDLPALVTVVSEINEPRIPAVTQILKAGRKPKKVLKPEDLGIRVREYAAQVQTLSNLAPIQNRKGILFKEGGKDVPALVRGLEEEGLLRR
jgi:electron transfer flavoprotein beta subunit